MALLVGRAKRVALMTNPLEYCLTGETAEIVDKLMGEFLFSCMGKNDMSIMSGFLASAALLIATHCERTGEDFDQLAGMAREQFALALKVSSETIERKRK